MTKYIELTQGKKAIVDDEDYEYLNRFEWRFVRGYALQRGSKDGKQIRLHRVVMERKLGRKLTESEIVDHKDRNPANNTRDNLRLVTSRQNFLNSSKSIFPKTSKFKGVYWSKAAKKWQAQIRHGKKLSYLGIFENEEDAAREYDKWARVYFGEFAGLNFPNESEIIPEIKVHQQGRVIIPETRVHQQGRVRLTFSGEKLIKITILPNRDN